MRHVALTTIAAFTAVVAIVACEQQAADSNLTAPEVDLRFAKSLGGQCDAARARLIGTQLTDYFTPKAIEDSAQALFAQVESNCANDSGKSLMLDYIQFTINHRLDRESGQTNALLLTHWNTVFPYVGYTGSNAPTNVPDSVFTVGAAKVIDGGVTDSLNAPNAALTFYAQDAGGDTRDHLFVIYPIGAGCLTGSNLQQFGPCYHFDAFPHQTSAWVPKALMGICEVHQTTDSIQFHIAAPALAHLDPTAKITDPATSHYPGFCSDETASIPQGSWHNGFGAAVTRLAWMAKRAVTPQSAYAGHGGLGGLGGGFSPVGAVDLEVFRATFSDDTVGKKPGPPETGSWTQQTKAPGTILVQSSLGDVSSNLAVLNQSGGNCKNCFGLLLQGNLEHAGTAFASDGQYDVTWTSLQDNANMKEAVFVLRSSSGADIARLTYAVRNNVKLILYNDTKTQAGTFVANWVQHVSNSFRIHVNLNDGTTTLYLDGSSTPVAGTDGVAFLTTKTNFATVSADFRGIDSGIIGWDNIIVTRLSDEQ